MTLENCLFPLVSEVHEIKHIALSFSAYVVQGKANAMGHSVPLRFSC